MHFGEPIDDERLVGPAAPRRRDRHRDHRRRLRRGRRRRAARARARRASTATPTASSAPSATTSSTASATGRAAFRASPTRACAAPTSTPATCAGRPRPASSGSASTRFDLLLLHNPDRTGFTSEAVWDGMAALRDAGLADAIGVAPGPANGFTLDLIDCFERFGDRIDWAMVILNPLEPWPGELCLDAAAAQRRPGDHPGRRLRRPVLGRRPAPATSSPSTTTAAFAPTAGSRPAASGSSGCGRSPSAPG